MSLNKKKFGSYELDINFEFYLNNKIYFDQVYLHSDQLCDKKS